MDRRNFIKLTAVTGASATLASCGNPEHQLIRFVPDEDIVPGVAQWKPSVCPLCSAGCGVNVRVMDADVDTLRNGQAGTVTMMVAKKLEGQADHPISRGGLCARGQAAIQITYHPDRVTQPMKRTGARGAGEFKPITWDEAVAELVARLDGLAARQQQQSLAVLTRPHRGRRMELFAEFSRGFGGPVPMACEPFGDEVLRRANAFSFGREQLPTFDFARSRYVISFGADFLGTWNSPVAHSAAYGEMRQGHPQVRGKLVQIEPRMSLTGASADEWIPAKPGTEAVLALGLAHLISRESQVAGRQSGVASRQSQVAGRQSEVAGRQSAAPSERAGALIAGWSDGLRDYTPDRVEQMTGVPAKRVERLARELVEFTPSVAVIGGAPLAHTNGLFAALAVNALNALLGAVERPGGLFFTPGHNHVPGATPQSVVEGLGRSRVLLLDDANPLYVMPNAPGVRETLEKIEFIASFGSFVEDTSAFADLILPDHSFLESWVASAPESGSLEAVTTVAGPVMKPIHNTRATADVLIEVAGKLKSPVIVPWKSGEELAKSPVTSRQSPVGSRPSAVTSRAYAEPRFEGDPKEYPFYFLPYPSIAFGDGSSAHLPWLQELPDPLTSAMWSSWVELNPQTAAKLGVAEGDLVDVVSAHGLLRAPAVIFPGLSPDVIAIPAGQGHEHFTRFASNRGVNPLSILAPATEPETGALAWAATRVKIARAGNADRSLIMFAGEMREHPHEYER